MKKLLLLLIACLALTLAACGGDDDDGGDSGSSGGTTTEQQPAEKPSGGGTAEVDIPDISFEPAALTVKAGTTVTWTNNDDLPHTVTKDGGPGEDFDSGTLQKGDTFEHTFTDAGEIDYVCTIHPQQTGTITVGSG